MARRRAISGQALLGDMAAELDRLPVEHLRALAPILSQAEAELASDLAKWLRTVEDAEATFTAQRMRVALVQIRGAMRKLQGTSSALFDVLEEAGRDAGHMAIGHLARQVEKFSALFEHSLRQMPMPAAATLARGESLLLRRFKQSADAYGEWAVNEVQRQLAVGVVRGETFAELTKRLQRLNPTARNVAGMVHGPGQVADDIAAGIGRRIKNRAELIVRTEAISAYNETALRVIGEAEAEDPDYLARWDATLDMRGCDLCRSLHGVTRQPGKEFPGGVKCPPRHPRCFPAGTPILTSRGYVAIESVCVGDLVLTHRQRWRRVVALSRQHTTGDLVALHWRGHVLRATANHPFLTPAGWVEAERLCVPSAETYVLEGVPAVPNDAPSERKQVGLLGDVLSPLHGRVVPVSAVDLDGNKAIGDGDVDIVLAHREGGDRSEVRESGAHSRLGPAEATALAGAGAPLEVVEGPGLAANGSVGCLGLSANLCPRHRAVAASVVLGNPAHHTGSMEDAIDRAAAAAIAFGEGHGGLPAEVEVDDLLIGRQIDELGHVRMVSVHPAATREAFDGEVFNFQVEEDESYIAGAFVVHNCRCALTFWHREWDKPTSAPEPLVKHDRSAEKHAERVAGLLGQDVTFDKSSSVSQAKVGGALRGAAIKQPNGQYAAKLRTGEATRSLGEFATQVEAQDALRVVLGQEFLANAAKLVDAEFSPSTLADALAKGDAPAMRRQARAALLEHGIPPRDPLIGGSADTLSFEDLPGGARGEHLTASGAIKLSREVERGMARELADMRVAPETPALKTLFHEELHGATPRAGLGILGQFYEGHGVVIEEVTVEMAARKVYTAATGHAVKYGSYQAWIDRVADEMSVALSVSRGRAMDMIAEAGLEMRRVGRRPVTTADSILDLFLDSLPPMSEGSRASLRARLAALRPT